MHHPVRLQYRCYRESSRISFCRLEDVQQQHILKNNSFTNVPKDNRSAITRLVSGVWTPFSRTSLVPYSGAVPTRRGCLSFVWAWLLGPWLWALPAGRGLARAATASGWRSAICTESFFIDTRPLGTSPSVHCCRQRQSHDDDDDDRRRGVVVRRQVR